MFIEISGSRRVRLESVNDIRRHDAGHYRVVWVHGTVETLTATDGDALWEAISQLFTSSAKRRVVAK